MKTWDTLQKGDILHLLVPEDILDISLKYRYQQSKVISIKKYEYGTFIRFKITDYDNRRKRINLAVNKLKYNNECIPVDIKTRWAHENFIKFGDIIVTFKDKETLNNAYKYIIDEKIEEQKKLIEQHQLLAKKLNELKNEIYI